MDPFAVLSHVELDILFLLILKCQKYTNLTFFYYKAFKNSRKNSRFAYKIY